MQYKPLRVHEVVEAYADAHHILFEIKQSLCGELGSVDGKWVVHFIQHAMKHIRDASSEVQNSFHSKWIGR